MADDFQIVRDHLRVGADFLGDGLVALDRIEERLRVAEEALERLAKVDPFDESDLPYVTASRDLQARIEFAAASLAALSQKEVTP